MTPRAQLRQAMMQLIEATHPVSAITAVPVETLVVAMLAAVKREDANALLGAARFFAPLHLPEVTELWPVDDAFGHFLSLVERDNPALYNKLRSLD